MHAQCETRSVFPCIQPARARHVARLRRDVNTGMPWPAGRFPVLPISHMNHSNLRRALVLCVCALAMTGCGGRLVEERRERPPLREVFPPPSIETPSATAPAPRQPAAIPASGAPPTAAAGAVPSEAPAEPAAPPPQSGASLKAPADSRSLEPPALDEDGLDAREPPEGEPAPGHDLQKEFDTAPAPESSTGAPGEAASATQPPARAAETAAAIAPDAPRIIVSTRPALLVSIDGEPEYGPVDGTKLQRVMNTPSFLLKGLSGNHYLSVYDGFMWSKKLTGPWTVLTAPPRVVQEAKARALVDGEADVLAGRPDLATGQRPTLKQVNPRILVSTRPAALVVIRGEPAYEPVEGTQLSRVVNTDARLFVHRPADRTYLELAQRWYRAPSLKGPWEQVEPGGLPPGLEEAAAGNE
jgi:hypothetical protein